MAYDEGLAGRVRERLAGEPGLIEKKMFAGIGFMLDGNMCCGVSGDGLIVRIPRDEQDALMAEPGAGEFMGSGRPMRGWIRVSPEGIAEDDDLRRWIERGITVARSLPPK
jgi:TfoX/Sxy family transcriptional regulator of competence genes